VFYEGRSVSIYDIIEALCDNSENKTAETHRLSTHHQGTHGHAQKLRRGEIFVRERGSCRIKRELVSCDYYDSGGQGGRGLPLRRQVYERIRVGGNRDLPHVRKKGLSV
jgi:hypothetical protein